MKKNTMPVQEKEQISKEKEEKFWKRIMTQGEEPEYYMVKFIKAGDDLTIQFYTKKRKNRRFKQAKNKGKTKDEIC